jgi:hypothetical protein
VSAHKSLSVHSEYTKLLTSIFSFMRKSGFRKHEILNICGEALKGMHDSRAAEVLPAATLAAAALTLDAWYRDRKYLNRTQPRAIPLFGPAPSIEALARSQDKNGDPVALARYLKSLGLVVRCGRNRYRPSDRIALVTGLDPVIQQYVARSSATLLATIKHNTSRIGSSGRLIERFAEVPDLPRGHVAQFRRFAQIQGWAFIRMLNDWLESRRPLAGSTRPERTVRAGVHLYAYVDKTRRKAQIRDKLRPTD